VNSVRHTVQKAGKAKRKSLALPGNDAGALSGGAVAPLRTPTPTAKSLRRRAYKQRRWASYMRNQRDARNARRREQYRAERTALGLTVQVRRKSLTPEERIESKRIKRHNRDAKKRGAGGRLSYGIRRKLFFLQKGKCAACGMKGRGLSGFHLDHIEPLALGGSHADANMQLLCPPCNLRKSSKPPVKFMQEMGMLL